MPRLRHHRKERKGRSRFSKIEHSFTPHEIQNKETGHPSLCLETSMAPKKPSKAAITKALRTILDPELFVSIVDLGLVYDIFEKEGVVKITMTLTTIGCPLFQTIENEVKEKILAIPNVKSVEVELTFDPPWDPSRLSEKAKAELGME